jgi:sugar phosphate isomerase/epimerase
MAAITRRALLRSSAIAGLGMNTGWGAVPKTPVGVTDWNLRLGANPEALSVAAQLGFDGLQISFGRRLAGGKMPLDNAETIATYRRLARERNIPIVGTCVDRLHDEGLKSEPQASKWVLDAIRLTRELNTKVLLLPFFGKWAIGSRQEMDAVGDRLRELAPEAAKAGVILALEDTISAEDNVRIIERSQSKHVQVYYDTGNAHYAGFDVVKEIRWLGKDRICQVHLKDNPHFLGEGKIAFPAVIAALRGIAFDGFAVLETDSRPDSLEQDMRRNLAYARGLLA